MRLLKLLLLLLPLPVLLSAAMVLLWLLLSRMEAMPIHRPDCDHHDISAGMLSM